MVVGVLLREQFLRKLSKQLPDTGDLLIKHLEQALGGEGQTTVESDFWESSRFKREGSSSQGQWSEVSPSLSLKALAAVTTGGHAHGGTTYGGGQGRGWAGHAVTDMVCCPPWYLWAVWHAEPAISDMSRGKATQISPKGTLARILPLDA